MFNPQVGVVGEADGRSFIRTAPGTMGHAVYGPYRWLDPGDYAVEFQLACEGAAPRGNPVCAILDVTSDFGARTLARQDVKAAELGDEPTPFALRFTLEAGAVLEFRIFTTGSSGLLIDGHQRLIVLSDDSADDQIAAGRFPDRTDSTFLKEHQGYFRELHEKGADVQVQGDAVVLTVDGVRFLARCPDDINFVGELFFENAYNFTLEGDACVIDVGMNLGLASLRFAARPEVKRVIAFEPFRETYARALANIALNPALAAKITPVNRGLADRTEARTVTVAQTADSGAMSTVGATEGTAIAIEMQDAAAALGPIIDQARADGLKMIVKVDCEGSEFAVFASLEAAGLLGRIDALMVEWHMMFPDKNQETLIAPLRRHGFVVFDRSPPIGNGFFYAARIAAA